MGTHGEEIIQAGLSIWHEVEVLLSPGKQDSNRHDLERERGAWGRAGKPLEIAACDDLLTSVCVSHCQTSWGREKILSLGKDFILLISPAQRRKFTDSRSGTVGVSLAAKLPLLLPPRPPGCVPPGCVCCLAGRNVGAGTEETHPGDHHHSSAELLGTCRAVGRPRKSGRKGRSTLQGSV